MRLHGCMDLLVAHQPGCHGKCHATLRAFVRPYSSMNCKMFGKVGGLGECFGANWAGIGAHATMDLPVLCHAAG